VAKNQFPYTAPDFELMDQSGRTISLSAFNGKSCVVLYFYPRDGTPGCTAEACAFRDSYEQFKDLGAEVIGISSDTADSHEQFAGKHNLPFHLLSDRGGKVRELYHVPSTWGLLPGRVTFVIDKAGQVRYSFNSQLNATGHVTEALRILRQLSADP